MLPSTWIPTYLFKGKERDFALTRRHGSLTLSILFTPLTPLSKYMCTASAAQATAPQSETSFFGWIRTIAKLVAIYTDSDHD
jgi:hypothetical protein